MAKKYKLTQDGPEVQALLNKIDGLKANQTPGQGVEPVQMENLSLGGVLYAFLTSAVSNLLYYYTKSETYSKSEVDALVAAIKQFTIQSVDALPQPPSAATMNILYLVPAEEPKVANEKDEFITVIKDGSYAWEQIGSTAIDLSGYVTTEALNTALADYVTSDALATALAGLSDVKYTSQSLTDSQKAQARTNIGAGTYSKPSTGIPASDLASGVIPDVSQFITKSVNDLTNYYLKSETYTKTEVQNLIAAINQFHYEIAASTSAVTDPSSNVLYLIGPSGTGADKYEEYVYANNTWTKIGDTSIDLSDYVTTTALNTALAGYVTSGSLATALADYWSKAESVTLQLADVAVTGDFNDLINRPSNSTPSSTSPLMDGTASVGTETAFARGDHRHPSDTSKQDVIADLSDIRSGAASGATAYQKPSSGIPKNDLAQAVKDSLGLADSALQSETDPTVPAWAKAPNKPSYTAQEVGALPSSTSIPSALSDLSEDTTHRVVTDAEKTAWNGKYAKPSTGIPASDLAEGVIPTQVELTTSIINQLWEAAL